LSAKAHTDRDVLAELRAIRELLERLLTERGEGPALPVPGVVRPKGKRVRV
jgi:hypothetical protein